MADAFGSLGDLADDLERHPGVTSARVAMEGEHHVRLLVELPRFDPDVWDSIITQLDHLARQHVHTASVDVDIRVLSSA